jgi:hypothetical protein
MRRLVLLTLASSLAAALVGCGSKEDKALDTSAPPPGPSANPNPPTKQPGERAPRPRVFPGGTAK